MNNFSLIQELLQQRADLYTRLSLLLYDGTPEMKENKSGKAQGRRRDRRPRLKRWQAPLPRT